MTHRLAELKRAKEVLATDLQGKESQLKGTQAEIKKVKDYTSQVQRDINSL